MKGKLTKLSDNKNALRTNEIEGKFEHLPKVGQSFTIIGEPLKKGMLCRLVMTTAVEELLNPEYGVYILNTVNSTYRLEVDENELEGTIH